MAHAFTRGMPGILETHDGHENIHILAQINVSLWLKWKKIVLLFICSHSGLRHKINNISYSQHVQILNKGGKFLEKLWWFVGGGG